MRTSPVGSSACDFAAAPGGPRKALTTAAISHLMACGGAQVYAGERTPEWFEVRLREGDPDVSFSYRLAAKRLGCEQQHLDRASWADDDPDLYPEKRVARERTAEGI